MARKISSKSALRTLHDVSLGPTKRYRPGQGLGEESIIAKQLLRECGFPATSGSHGTRAARRRASRIAAPEYARREWAASREDDRCPLPGHSGGAPAFEREVVFSPAGGCRPFSDLLM